MRRYMGIVLIFIATFTIFTCSETTNNSDIKPGSVQLVAKSSDTAPYEKGIDAVPEGSDAIYIEWRTSEDPTVTGYRVYRKKDGDALFTSLVSLSETDTSWQDQNVNLNTRYYYYVTSVNDDDVESVPSDTIDYLLIAKATGLRPSGTVSESQPGFQWTEPGSTPQGYIIKLQKQDEDSFIWIYSLDQDEIDYGGTDQPRSDNPIYFNQDGTASIDALEKGQTYQWRVDKQGGVNSGSESHWSIITIQ